MAPGPPELGMGCTLGRQLLALVGLGAGAEGESGNRELFTDRASGAVRDGGVGRPAERGKRGGSAKGRSGQGYRHTYIHTHIHTYTYMLYQASKAPRALSAR